jgi:hypothetical protein
LEKIQTDFTETEKKRNIKTDIFYLKNTSNKQQELSGQISAIKNSADFELKNNENV